MVYAEEPLSTRGVVCSTPSGVVVLRYGHRAVRDYRVTSHCALVARAFGAERIIIQGEKDESIGKSVGGVAKRWGGKFKVEFSDSWRGIVNKYRKKGYVIVHLTMYGEEILGVIGKIRKRRKVVVIIGSQKVEGEVYRMADYNVAVTQQPHSEIAALSVFLHEYFGGKELGKKFAGAKIRVVAQKTGKKVLKSK